jgi:hypothetical protein
MFGQQDQSITTSPKFVSSISNGCGKSLFIQALPLSSFLPKKAYERNAFTFKGFYLKCHPLLNRNGKTVVPGLSKELLTLSLF